MKTLTILKNAEKALNDILTNTCKDYYDYDRLIDFDACKKSLESIKDAKKQYENPEKPYKQQAKLITYNH